MPQFRDLLFHRGYPCLFAFDLLVCDGKAWRKDGLADRKQELRRLLARVAADSRLRYVDHIDGLGTALCRAGGAVRTGASHEAGSRLAYLCVSVCGAGRSDLRRT